MLEESKQQVDKIMAQCYKKGTGDDNGFRNLEK